MLEKLKNFSSLIVFFLCAAFILSACVDKELRDDYDTLLGAYEALKNEHNALQGAYDRLEYEYDAIKDAMPEMLYNPILHSQTSTLGVLAQLLRPHGIISGRTFIIRSKDEFDAIFTEEVKTAYNNQITWYSDAVLNANEFADFDTDFPYGAMDFSKRMLIFRAYPRGDTGLELMLDDVRMTGELYERWGDLRTLHVRTSPVDLDHQIGAAETVRGLVLELDQVDFAQVYFYTPIIF